MNENKFKSLLRGNKENIVYPGGSAGDPGRGGTHPVRNRGRRIWTKELFQYAPDVKKDSAEANADLVNKYKKKAALAGFDNSWLRRIAAADPAKSLYENNVTTGNTLEGKVISVESVARACPYCVEQFLAALRERKGYHSPRFAFRGYEATLWINEPEENGNILAGLSVEFRNCGNGYYYLLINEKEFIGYDID